MKKLYRKGTVHPTPPLILDHLSFLPATILSLTVALSPQDREVLAYLISCSSSNNTSGNRRTSTTTSRTIGAASHGGGCGARSGGADHPPSFNCYCFRCYMSYWVRWDSSPNRQLIHEIIDAFEDELVVQSKKENRKERRKSKGCGGSAELKSSEQAKVHELPRESDSVEESGDCGGAGGEDGDGEEEEFEKGSVRRFVSFLGEKIWGVWN